MDYISQAENLIRQHDTYRTLGSDPNKKHKNKFIILLKIIKVGGKLGENTYRSMYPTAEGLAKFMCYPKVIEKIHLNSIVSKELASVLRMLVGQSPITLTMPKILWNW